MKSFLKSFTNFNRKEQRGLLILSVILIILTFLRFILAGFERSQRSNVEYIILSQDEESYPENDYKIGAEEILNSEKSLPEVDFKEMFVFDPNKLDSAGWVLLGLRPRQASSIIKYRRKGGRFRKADDLARLRVIPPQFYERVKPYIRIEEENISIAPLPAGNDEKPDAAEILAGERFAPLDINTASAEDMTRFLDITEQLAEAIVNYRERWQGFDSLRQLKRVRGMSEALFQRLKPRITVSAPRRNRINLNYATEEEMKALPGIGAVRARLLRQSRLREGPFRSFSDLRNRNLLPDSVLTIIESRIEF